ERLTALDLLGGQVSQSRSCAPRFCSGGTANRPLRIFFRASSELPWVPTPEHVAQSKFLVAMMQKPLDHALVGLTLPDGDACIQHALDHIRVYTPLVEKSDDRLIRPFPRNDLDIRDCRLGSRGRREAIARVV